ncbi:hypothetical protein Tco_0511926 [Tanacetum coccineum]
MAAPDLNGTNARPCLYNPNPAEPKSDNYVKIEISTEIIMKLRNNAYNGDEANDAADHITRFLQIIDLVKTPGVNTEQLCVLTFPYSLSGKAHRWLAKVRIARTSSNFHAGPCCKHKPPHVQVSHPYSVPPPLITFLITRSTQHPSIPLDPTIPASKYSTTPFAQSQSKLHQKLYPCFS